jgi:hypothetical protein
MAILVKAAIYVAVFSGGFFAGTLWFAATVASEDDLREHRRKYAESQRDE